MDTVRVIYRLKFRSGDLERLKKAWRAVVNAHKAAGHASLESVLLVDKEELLQPQVMATATAISRWRSQEDWEAQRTDEVDAEAYKVFRDLCEVESKKVLHEVSVIRDEPAVAH